jgi:hypothetical protein
VVFSSYAPLARFNPPSQPERAPNVLEGRVCPWRDGEHLADLTEILHGLGRRLLNLDLGMNGSRSVLFVECAGFILGVVSMIALVLVILPLNCVITLLR